MLTLVNFIRRISFKIGFQRLIVNYILQKTEIHVKKKLSLLMFSNI
jgi:hypothetical protein